MHRARSPGFNLQTVCLKSEADFGEFRPTAPARSFRAVVKSTVPGTLASEIALNPASLAFKMLCHKNTGASLRVRVKSLAIRQKPLRTRL
jgi:hypothetical protein